MNSWRISDLQSMLNHTEVGSNTGEGMPHNRIDELANKRVQADKSKASFFLVLLCELTSESVTQI